MAKIAPPEIAGPALDKIMNRLKLRNPGATDEMVATFRNLFNVVQFKKNAVIIDYGQQNKQLMFRQSGKVRLFMNMDEETNTEGWVSNRQDTLFVTQEIQSEDVSTYKMIVEKPALFVTLHWDDHMYLVNKYPKINFYQFAYVVSFSYDIIRELKYSSNV